jgi:hypothetical protein
MSVFWYGWRERDLILDCFEMSSASGMHPRYFQVGGVAEDIPTGFDAKVRAFTKQFPKRVDQLENLITQNQIVLERMRGVGAVDARRCSPRRHRPAAARRRQPVGPAQGAARTLLRGLRLQDPGRHGRRQLRPLPRPDGRDARVGADHRPGARRLPEGDYITSDRKYALPPRHELATSMEALIHHFKLVTEGFRVPPGEAYYPIESPRGELACFVRADGSSKPARVHMRDPSFVNLQAFKPMVQDLYIADLIARSRCSTRSSGGSTADGHRSEPGQALRPRLARPGLGRLRRPDEGPGGRPRPRDDVRARARAHGDRGADGQVPDIRSAAIPAMKIVQPSTVGCSPTAIEQAACVMRLTPRTCPPSRLLRHVRARPKGSTDVYVCTNISCSLLRRGRDLRAAPSTVLGRRPGLSTCALRVPGRRARSPRWPSCRTTYRRARSSSRTI